MTDQTVRLLCNFQPIEANEAGWKRHRCARCNFETKFIPNLGQPIIRDCDFASDGSRWPTPGTSLAELIAEIGITDDGNCGCAAFAALMDAWGADGCRTNRDFIIERLQSAATSRWIDAITSGGPILLTTWFRIADPFGSIVDEAIRRAEHKARKTLLQRASEILFGPPL
jgi:hypothetical protein